MNHKEFRSKARKCPYHCKKFNGDWHTCDHSDNPTVIRVCSVRHCPTKEFVETKPCGCDPYKTGCHHTSCPIGKEEWKKHQDITKRNHK